MKRSVAHPKLDSSFWTRFRTDEFTLKLSTLRHTSGSRIKSGMTYSSWKHPLPIQAVGNPSSQTRFVILNLIQDRWIHSQAINVAAYDCPESSSGWRIKFRMTTDQVRDDKYREPHLKEDVSIIHYSLFIMHYETQFGVSLLCIMNCELWIVNYALFIMHC